MKSSEKEKLDENATDIIHMSAHDSPINEENVDMNQSRNPTPIGSDQDKSFNMLFRKIEKTADFTDSKDEKDIAINSSTEPTKITLEGEQKKYEKRAEEKVDESAPDIIHMSSDDNSDNEETVEINQPRSLTTTTYYPETLCSDRSRKIEMPTDFTEGKEMSADDSSDYNENVEINQPRDPTSINSDPYTSNSDRVQKIEILTDLTEVQEDMVIDRSTELATRTFIVAQKDYEKKPKDDRLDENASNVIDTLKDDIFDNQENAEMNKPRDPTSIHSKLDKECSTTVTKIKKPTDLTKALEYVAIDSSIEPVLAVQAENVPRKEEDREDNTPTTLKVKWTVPNIAGYFDFDETVRKIEIPTDLAIGDKEVSENIQFELIQKLQVVKAVQTNKRKKNYTTKIVSHLKAITVTECGSRLVLDALLIPLCYSLGLNIEVDKNIDCKFLPNCRFDYCIAKDGKIFGCVETKSIKSLNDSAVAQALLQLLILQTNLLRVDNLGDAFSTKCPLFAVVTDGHRFVYIQLQESVFKFEHEGKKVKVREIAHENDIKCILEQIGYLMNEATAALGGTYLGSSTVTRTNSMNSNKLLPNVIDLDDHYCEDPSIIVID
ncbi:unnamed protein product [Mytilus coruscus]|uniref:Uncharacterized protein n=1 Tax=Mytilus coruscus TaxID=42192 RepID=A0A6J8CXA7_MYTCO|nr:unnamed protein product [Mytilus coruscus]